MAEVDTTIRATTPDTVRTPITAAVSFFISFLYTFKDDSIND
jgi:hypothetical protein